MPAPWTQLPVLSLDTETTGVDVFNDRVVELAAVEVWPDGGMGPSYVTIVDPGVEVPDEAAAIHGITTERAVAEGTDPTSALRRLAETVWAHVLRHDGQAAVAIMNARFDLPLIIAECARHGVEWPPFAGILDPLVIDKACDHWRKDEIHHRPVAHTHSYAEAREHRRSRRKLLILADRYGVDLSEEDAHGALADATAAGRVLFRIAERFPQVAQHSLSTLWAKQVRQAARQRDGLQDWIRQNRDPSAELVGGWPLPERPEQRHAPAPQPVTAGAPA